MAAQAARKSAVGGKRTATCPPTRETRSYESPCLRPSSAQRAMSAPKKQKTDAANVPIVYHEPKVLAEIGCNHMGDVEIAKELLTLAKQAGCEYGKFQKRNPKELLISCSRRSSTRRRTPARATRTATRTARTASSSSSLLSSTRSSRSTATRSALATRARSGTSRRPRSW